MLQHFQLLKIMEAPSKHFNTIKVSLNQADDTTPQNVSNIYEKNTAKLKKILKKFKS